MKLFSTLQEFPEGQGCALTLGTFDGVHRGHRWLIAYLREAAEARGLPLAVLTFRDMPICTLDPEQCPGLLTLPEEKSSALEACGVDYLYLIDFTRELATCEAEDFVRDILLNQLRVRTLLAGPDVAVGRGRRGNAEMLGALADQWGFEFLRLDDRLMLEDGPISSTRIREALENADVRRASRMLGRHYQMSGPVISQRRLGRTLGFPTINLQISGRKVLPAFGVYAGWATCRGIEERLPAAINIGVSPTVDGETVTVEFHVPGKNIATTPEWAAVELVDYLRPEAKFDSLDQLKTQMQQDVLAVQNILDSEPTNGRENNR